MRNIVIAALGGLLVCALAAPASAQVSFNGKKTAFQSTGGPVGLPGPAPGPLLVGSIAKGKKKTVLTVEATLASGFLAPFAPWTLSMGVDVNGIPMNPGTTYPVSVEQDCGSSALLGPFGGIAEGCNLSANFMIDLDAAELASPGCCYNVPLTVTLMAGEGSNPIIAGIPVDATMAVRMEKKK